MSRLSQLAAALEPRKGVNFMEKFQTKVLQLDQTMHYNIDRATSEVAIGQYEYDWLAGGNLNTALESDIRSSGDAFAGRNSSASCHMTKWDMHKHYETFSAIGELAISAAKEMPLAKRSHADGTDNPIDYYVQETWGLIYTKGHTCKAHTHWPSCWSYTYCVTACEDCSPLVFPTSGEDHSVSPRSGQLILFPSWVNHYVPVQKCDHERIMISGNLDVVWER